jgi:hypothetical protein
LAVVYIMYHTIPYHTCHWSHPLGSVERFDRLQYGAEVRGAPITAAGGAASSWLPFLLCCHPCGKASHLLLRLNEKESLFSIFIKIKGDRLKTKV